MTDATEIDDMAAAMKPLTLDVVSDVMCPWCYIGKRRIEKAIARTKLPVTLVWRPFQLDPTLPAEGKDRATYLAEKFGSAEAAEGMYSRVREAGAEEGIPFAFDRIRVSSNTLDAHRLIRWATREGVADPVVEALFRAYFVEGRNIGDRNVLIEIAEDAGMEDVAARLESDEDVAVTQEEIARAGQMGVTGVPTTIVAGKYALVGAQPADTIAQALMQIAEREAAGNEAEG